MVEQKPEGSTQAYDGYIHKIEGVLNWNASGYGEHKPISLIYFCSVGGREDKSKFEWEHSPVNIYATYAALADRLKQRSDKRVVFAISFLPITKILGWEIESKESNLQLIELLDTKSMEPIPRIQRNTEEIGCLLENLIFAEETKLWSKAGTPETYFIPQRDKNLRVCLFRPNKLYDAEQGEK